MPRTKAPATPTTPANRRQPEPQDLVEALRINHRLLNELALRYQVSCEVNDPDNPGQDSPGHDPLQINTPQDIYNLMAPEMSGLTQEQLRVLLLNIRNQVIGQRILYQGNVNSAIVRVPEVLRPAIVEGAPHIVICHNHPSSDSTPSPEDLAITRRIKDAAALMDIELLDHVVIGRGNHTSMKEKHIGGF